jgi:hypothetical protein
MSGCNCVVNLERGDMVQVTMPKPYIKYKIISSSRSSYFFLYIFLFFHHFLYFPVLGLRFLYFPIFQYKKERKKRMDSENSERLVLQIDASETGLGATFMQENQPIAYASRAFTDTETKYAQIEKELLSVILGLERLNKFCSKHQLCTFLFLVYIEDVCHISATVATYAVIVLVLHEAVSSKLILAVCDLTSLELEMYIADTLSRAYLKDLPNDNESDFEGVNMLSDLPISEQNISEIQQAVPSRFGHILSQYL